MGHFRGAERGRGDVGRNGSPGPLVRLKAFEKNQLLTVEGGPGWLHLDFTNGWIRVVANTWEPWSIILPDIWWTDDICDNPSGAAEVEQ